MARYEGQAALGRYIYRQRHARNVNAFADLLADGIEPGEAARRLGFRESWGRSVLTQIRRGLGPQAC